jgi:hypothetical protein
LELLAELRLVLVSALASAGEAIVVVAVSVGRSSGTKFWPPLTLA